MNDRLGGLMVVVTGVVLAALRYWPLHGCADCVIFPSEALANRLADAPQPVDRRCELRRRRRLPGSRRSAGVQVTAPTAPATQP